MPGELVSRFIRLIEQGDVAQAATLLAPDCEYDNVPIGKVVGAEQVVGILQPFVARYDEVDWVVHRQVAQGTLSQGTVLNERTDRFRAGDHWVELPVAGVFEVRDGLITLWRDYFDLASLQRATAG